MTYDEVIKYASDTCFCCGCPVDMATVGLDDPCNRCEHRMFFEMVISAFLALKKFDKLEPLILWCNDDEYTIGYNDCLSKIKGIFQEEHSNDD